MGSHPPRGGWAGTRQGLQYRQVFPRTGRAEALPVGPARIGERRHARAISALTGKTCSGLQSRLRLLSQRGEFSGWTPSTARSRAMESLLPMRISNPFKITTLETYYSTRNLKRSESIFSSENDPPFFESPL